MAFAVADRVKETTTTTGTGTISLSGAETGFQTFVAGVGSGNTTYYAIIDDATGDYEVGVGTVTDATPDTLSRDTVFTSSNSDAKVDFQAGTKNVFVTQPADKAVYKDSGSDDVTIDKIQLINQSSHPTYSQGLLWYDTIHNTLNYYGDESDIVHEVGMEEHQKVYNNSGVTINKGEPMYFSGNFNGYPTVGKADATDVNKYNAQGLAGHDIENNSYGYLITAGLVEDIDTSGLTAGQNFFVGLTAGAVQNASPTYPNYPMCLGWVVNSDASNGVLLVNQQNHSVRSFRVQTDTHIGGDMIIDGDLTVVGSQTVASSTNVETGAPFLYLNSGDTIGEANTTFTGSGLDDAYFAGHFSGTASTTYYVKIDATGTPDTFSWSKDNFSTTEATGVAITGGEQTLDNGIKIDFGATTGHTLNDVWSGTAAPTNVDTGIWSNRNTGGSGVGYTHVGLFFDVTDSKFKLVDEYDPEPTGSINTGDASYSAGTLVVDDIEGADGTLSGALSVTGNITVGGTVDGRDVAADGTKLDGIETNATADQTDAEIKTAYENNSDTNAFTDALLTKLNGIEANATADQTAADIRGLGFFDTSNDGSGSGLDADLLDGNHASAFATLSGSTFTGQVSVSSTAFPPLEAERNAGSATTGNYAPLKLNTITSGTPASGLGAYATFHINDTLKGSIGFENDGSFHFVNGSDADLLSFDSTGNTTFTGQVKIDTSTENALDILADATNQTLLRLSHPTAPADAGGYFAFNSDGTTDNNVVTFGVEYSGVEYDVFNIQRSTRNVGIGTPNPSDRLEVKGATSAGVIVISSGDTTITGNDVIGQLNFKDYDADAHVGGDQDDVVNIKAIALHETGGASAFDGSANEGYALSFSTSKRPSANAAFTVSEAMRIDEDGNVGIGTSSLTSKLTVSGDKYVLTNSGQSDGIRLYSSTAPANGDYTQAVSFGYTSGSSAIAGLRDGADSDQMGLAFIVHGSATGSADATEAMRIDSAGDATFNGKITAADPDFANQLEIKRTSGAQYSMVKFSNTAGELGKIGFTSGGVANIRLGASTADNTIWHSGNDGSGSTLDADTVDGIQGASFLRSDADDSATGVITFNGGSTSSYGPIVASTSTAGPAIKLDANGTDGKDLWVISNASANTDGGGRIQFWNSTDSRTFATFAANAGERSKLYNPVEIQHTNLSGEPYSGLHIKNTNAATGNAYTGLYIDAPLQSHVRLATAGSLKWQMRTGTTVSGDLRFYSWDGSADVLKVTSGGALTVTGSVTTPSLFVGDGTDGEFYSDAAGRTAFRNGEFYITNSVSNFYCYATNTYLGNGGDNIRLRNNTMFGDYWVLSTNGNVVGGSNSVPTGPGQVALVGSSTISTSPYISFHEGSTRRFYIQYNISGNYPVFHNEEGQEFRFYTNGNATSIPLYSNSSSLRGYVYANSSNSVGFLDSDGNWAVRATRDVDVDFLVNNVEKFSIGTSSTTSANDITVNSDERIKDNIEQIDGALEKVQAIRGVTFNRTDTDDDTRHAGVIAQEVEKVLPEVVTENEETGIKSVAYANMVGLLIEAIKEQQTQIDDLKAEVTRLKGFE